MQVEIEVSPLDVIVLEHMAKEQGTTKEVVAASIINPSRDAGNPMGFGGRTVQQVVRERLSQLAWEQLNAGTYPQVLIDLSAAKANAAVVKVAA